MIKDKVNKMYNFAEARHVCQVRKFSELPYFTHPKAVARILEQMKYPEEIICIALGHDLLEDTKTTYREIVELFGIKIAEGIHALSNDKFKGSKADYLIQKITSLPCGLKAVKFADRLHNVQWLHIDKIPMEFKLKYYKETRKIINNVRADDVKQAVLLSGIEFYLNKLQIQCNFKDYLCP